MRTRRAWKVIREIGFALLIINQLLALPSYIKSFSEIMFQQSHESLSGHQIWSAYGGDVNVRNCPNQRCDIVVTLPYGTVIRSIELVDGEMIEDSYTWHRIEHKGSTGFVFGKLVRDIDNFA